MIRSTFRILLCIAPIVSCCFRIDTVTAGETIWVYFAADGVHQFSFDLETGAMQPLSSNQDAKPSFLAFHPNEQFLYGCGNQLSAFSIDPQSGKLTFLNAVPYDKHGHCHLSVDKTGSNVLSAG